MRYVKAAGESRPRTLAPCKSRRVGDPFQRNACACFAGIDQSDVGVLFFSCNLKLKEQKKRGGRQSPPPLGDYLLVGLTLRQFLLLKQAQMRLL